ncbi:MAG TPA: SDR family oxidoreductase [Acidimicrobiales bacterium]|nr:SDR family oxidoreductase [Acidimicrobiales bacterium]
MDLEGKVAIVTGASAGIGRAYALALAGAGATVVAAARTLGRTDDEPAARNTLAEVVEAGGGLPGRISAHVCDVEDDADVALLMDQTATNFGRIDVLVNNAGVMVSHRPFDVTIEEWDRIMRVNVRGPYLAIRHVAPHMIRQRSGSIINVTARAAAFIPRGTQAQGSIAYAVSKAALNRLSFYMAEELKRYGIAVNALSPGIVRTDTALTLNPKAESDWGKAPTPDVLGPALLYLARQTAETMTGQVLHTDEFEQTWP